MPRSIMRFTALPPPPPTPTTLMEHGLISPIIWSARERLCRTALRHGNAGAAPQKSSSQKRRDASMVKRERSGFRVKRRGEVWSAEKGGKAKATLIGPICCSGGGPRYATA
eukprot:scaffold7063_cov351-Pinguiococcus_pyrenoidosus.AAC.1